MKKIIILLLVDFLLLSAIIILKRDEVKSTYYKCHYATNNIFKPTRGMLSGPVYSNHRGAHYPAVSTRKITMPVYNQTKRGYKLGCEGVSLYMCLRYKHATDYNLDEFMATIPTDEDNPYLGFVGDLNNVTPGKRQTIYPNALANWANEYTLSRNISGKDAKHLLPYIFKGHPVIIWVTGKWKEPKWKVFPFGQVVTNGHICVLVGYNYMTGDYLVNDCSGGKGEYYVDGKTFERIYNYRKYAVVVF